MNSIIFYQTMPFHTLPMIPWHPDPRQRPPGSVMTVGFWLVTPGPENRGLRVHQMEKADKNKSKHYSSALPVNLKLHNV